MTAAAPALVAARAGAAALPTWTWSEPARAALRTFCAHATELPAPTTVVYAPHEHDAEELAGFEARRNAAGILPHEASPSWHLELDRCPPAARAAIVEVARALGSQPLPPGGAAALTGLAEPVADGLMAHVVGALRAAFVELHGGDGLAAIAKPTDRSGEHPELGETGDGAIYPHADLWRPERIIGIFDEVVPGHGRPILLPLTVLWPLAAQAGMPARARRELEELLATASERSSTYEAFAGGLFDDPLWGEPLAELAHANAMELPGATGDGYLVDDRRWLHGRSALPWRLYPRERRHRRLYLLAHTPVSAAADAAPALTWSDHG